MYNDQGHATRAALVADLQTIEGVRAYFEKNEKENSFAVLEAVIEMHFRDDEAIYSNFEARNFLALNLLLEHTARAKTRELTRLILSTGITLEKLRNVSRTILVMERLSSITKEMQFAEPATN